MTFFVYFSPFVCLFLHSPTQQQNKEPIGARICSNFVFVFFFSFLLLLLLLVVVVVTYPDAKDVKADNFIANPMLPFIFNLPDINKFCALPEPSINDMKSSGFIVKVTPGLACTPSYTFPSLQSKTHFSAPRSKAIIPLIFLATSGFSATCKKQIVKEVED